MFSSRYLRREVFLCLQGFPSLVQLACLLAMGQACSASLDLAILPEHTEKMNRGGINAAWAGEGKDGIAPS